MLTPEAKHVVGALLTPMLVESQQTLAEIAQKNYENMWNRYDVP